MCQCELQPCYGLSYEGSMQVCVNMLPNSGGVTSQCVEIYGRCGGTCHLNVQCRRRYGTAWFKAVTAVFLRS